MIHFHCGGGIFIVVVAFSFSLYYDGLFFFWMRVATRMGVIPLRLRHFHFVVSYFHFLLSQRTQILSLQDSNTDKPRRPLNHT